MSSERTILLAAWALAALGALLGLSFSPVAGGRAGVGTQALDLVRVVTATALIVVVVIGPGIVWRSRSGRRPDLGFLPLPGLAVLLATGCLAWLLGAAIAPRVVCAAVVIPLLLLLLALLLRAGPGDLLEPGERRILLLVGFVLGVATAKSLWSLGPVGELYSGLDTRTLEVGDRLDSVISFDTVRLVAHGTPPYSGQGLLSFPYGLSLRGPLAGIAAAPLVLLAGGRPPSGSISHAWVPFDHDGFMAYRLAMITFAATAFLSVWELARRIADGRTARLAVLLSATTPFLVHEVWFTWPKLMAASLVLLAAVCVIDDRPLYGGLLLGTAYLVHPLALLSLPSLVLLGLWPLVGARARHPRVGSGLRLAGGVAAFLTGWRLVNGSHYKQGSFLDYLTEPGRRARIAHDLARTLHHPVPPVTFSMWLSDRLVSVGNTLVPLRLVILSAGDPELNVSCGILCSHRSAPIVQFFLQYWTTVPFGLGIAFFPLLLISLWRAARRWPWAVFVAVVAPFVLFAIYWGDASTGLLREGLHPWVLTVLVVVAVEQRSRGFPWLRSRAVRAVLTTRGLEILLVAVLPTVVTRGALLSRGFALTDSVALIAMLAFCGGLSTAVWREYAPRDAHSARRPDERG